MPTELVERHINRSDGAEAGHDERLVVKKNAAAGGGGTLVPGLKDVGDGHCVGCAGRVVAVEPKRCCLNLAGGAESL